MSKFTKDQLTAIKDVFDLIDKDQSGTIDLNEFKAAIKETGLNITDDEVIAKIAEADLDKDGKINYSEFLKHLEKDC